MFLIFTYLGKISNVLTNIFHMGGFEPPTRGSSFQSSPIFLVQIYHFLILKQLHLGKCKQPQKWRRSGSWFPMITLLFILGWWLLGQGSGSFRPFSFRSLAIVAKGWVRWPPTTGRGSKKVTKVESPTDRVYILRCIYLMAVVNLPPPIFPLHPNVYHPQK